MRHRLLVVDADDQVRRAYREHFGARGFEVFAARGPEQAAVRLAGRGFDAVIVDVGSGRGVVALLLAGAAGAAGERRRARPVLVLTAYGRPLHARTAASLGADVFLHKPASLDWLERLLRTRIARRRRASVAKALTAG